MRRRAAAYTIVALATVGGAVVAAAGVWVWSGIKKAWEGPRVLR